MSKTTNKFAPVVRDWAVRMLLDHEGVHPSNWAAITGGVPVQCQLGSAVSLSDR